MKALIIVDVQNDFLPGGSLAVPHGDLILPVINSIQSNYDLVVATQDWHPKNHLSFSSMHEGKKNYDQIELRGLIQTLWPQHCIQGTFGSEFSKDLNQNKIEAVFRKGIDMQIDSYSGFFDNGKFKSTGLGDYLKGRGIKSVDICGLAADYCVYFTAKDALELGFKSQIIENATRAINVKKFEDIKADFNKSGGGVIQV